MSSAAAGMTQQTQIHSSFELMRGEELVTSLLVLLTCELSGGMGEGDLDWKASWEMKPESWDETEERRAGVCWGSTEEDEEDEALKRKWEVGEWQCEPLERESLLFTLFRLLQEGDGRRLNIRKEEQGNVGHNSRHNSLEGLYSNLQIVFCFIYLSFEVSLSEISLQHNGGGAHRRLQIIFTVNDPQNMMSPLLIWTVSSEASLTPFITFSCFA